MQHVLIDRSYFAKNTDLANLKSNVDKYDIDKLEIWQVISAI